MNRRLGASPSRTSPLSLILLLCGMAASAPAAAASPATRTLGPGASGDSPENEADALQLAPLVVEEKFAGRAKVRAGGELQLQDVVGNLDLPRTQDDVLPFTIYDREALFRSGATDLEEFMRRELLEGAGPAGSKATGGVNGLLSDGSGVRLRGYGSDETVILINGRRLPETVTSGANAQPQPPNLNFIPLSLVERVEVLPVSASALYSGNPVGGVVNIVLRANVNVSEVTAHYSNATGGFDAPQSTLSVLHGQSLLGGALRLRFNATFTEVVPVMESELGYIRAATAASVPTARLYRATPNVRSTDGAALFGPGSAAFTSVAPGASGQGGLQAFAGRQGVRSLALFDAPDGLVNAAASVDFPYGPRQSSASAFASVVCDVRPWLQLGLDGLYSRMTATRGRDLFAADLRLAGDASLNPFGRSVEVSLNEWAPALGESYSWAQREFTSMVLGAMLKLPADWRVSLDAQQGRSLTRYRGLAGVSTSRWQQLVDRGVYQPLRDTQRFGPPPEFYDEVLIYAGGRGRVVSVGDYESLDTALRVTNPMLRFPTGTAAVNVGGDFRLTELAGYTDEQRFGDGSLAAMPVRWRGRTLQRLSVFGELQAPVVPARWLPGWLRELQTDLAARYTLADTTQEANIAPTGGLKIGLVGGIALRGSVATSNRLPTPYMNTKVESGTTLRPTSAGGVNYVAIFDPVRQERYAVRASDALNPNLRPEAAVTRSLGLLFERGRAHRVRISADLVDTQKSGELLYLDPQTLMNLETTFPQRVIREPLPPGDLQAAGRVSSLLKGNFNLAWRHSQNLTTAADYAWTECYGGTLELFARWSDFLRYDRQLLPGSPVIDALRQPDGSAPGLLEHRINLGGGWANRSYGFRIDGRYYGKCPLPAVEWGSQGGREIGAYWQFDVSVQKDLGAWLPWKSPRYGLEGQLRVNNVFDAGAPAYANDPSGAGVRSYGDWRRQTYTLSLRATF